MTRHPDRERSRALLIGVGKHSDAARDSDSWPADRDLGLLPLDGVVNNLRDLDQLLTDADRGTFTRDHCTVIENPSDQNTLGRAVVSAAGQAEDVLLVYYSGHGLLDRRGRLHLALTGTSNDNIEWSAVPFAKLRDAISDSPAAVRLLILDCCFSGRALDTMGSGDAEEKAIGQTDIRGTYTLVSSAANELSIAPSGHRNTAFTEALLTVLRREPGLSVSALYPRIKERLRSKGFPQPHHQTTDSAGQLILFGSTHELEEDGRPPAGGPISAGVGHHTSGKNSPVADQTMSVSRQEPIAALTYVPLPEPAEFSWMADWNESTPTRPQYRTCIELHVRPLQNVFIPGRVMRMLPDQLIGQLRSTGAVRPEAGVTPTVASDAVVVRFSVPQSGGYNQSYPGEMLGVRVDRNSQWSAWWTLPGDMLGAILDQHQLAATIATWLRKLAAIAQVDGNGINDQDRYAIAIGLDGSTTLVSEGEATGAPRRHATISRLGSAHVRVDPDESISGAAFAGESDQIAQVLVESLIEVFRRAQ